MSRWCFNFLGKSSFPGPIYNPRLELKRYAATIRNVLAERALCAHLVNYLVVKETRPDTSVLESWSRNQTGANHITGYHHLGVGQIYSHLTKSSFSLNDTGSSALVIIGFWKLNAIAHSHHLQDLNLPCSTR